MQQHFTADPRDVPMDQKDVFALTKQYAELVRELLPVTRVILFGSWARGTSTMDSDIDIAVLVNDIPGDYLTYAAALVKTGWKLHSRIEPVLLEEGSDESGLAMIIQSEGITAWSNDAA